MAGLPQAYGFRDARGFTTRVKMFLDSAATVAGAWQNGFNIGVDLDALTNLAVTQATGPFTSNAADVAYGAVGQYQDAEDKAELVFQTAGGSFHRYQIPGPLAAIFLADLETVDSTNALVKQFVADMLNATFGGTAPSSGQTKATVSRDGTSLVLFIGGIRLRRRTQRRHNIITKAPDLVGPDE